jgi:hypothetical protein
MVDYSRFDKIDISDDDDDEREQAAVRHGDDSERLAATAQTASSSAEIPDESLPGVKSIKMTSKTANGRIKFEYEGRTVYEWDQSLSECNIYIQPPAGVTKHMLDVQLTYTHLRVGLKGAPPFIDEDIFSTIVTEESYWMLSDGELNINLQKMKKGEVSMLVF